MIPYPEEKVSPEAKTTTRREMSIIDLSELRRQDRATRKVRKQAAEALKATIRSNEKCREEFLANSHVTISMFLQILAHAVVHREPDDEWILPFITNGMNYQLACFARAYGYDIDDEHPPIFVKISVKKNLQTGAHGLNYMIEGEFAEEVMRRINASNPELNGPEAATGETVSTNNPEGVVAEPAEEGSDG